MPRSPTTDLLIIDGGATGAGVLRDAAMRGMRALLVERGDLASGTTGRYHGLLHSGGRYVVTDPVSAEECARENEILRRIIPHCLEDTGGFFVTTSWDDPGYADQLVAGCRAHGVPCEELPVREILRREPLLNPAIARGFAIRDAAADSFLTVESLAASARAYGGQIRTYYRVVGLLRDGERVAGALVEDRRTGEQIRIEAQVVVNAAGAWASQIGAFADVEISIVSGKGTMLVLNHRIVNTVVSRCKRLDDGDIIVPIRTVAVVGTTDVAVRDSDATSIPADDVALMLDEGEKLVPGLRRARVVRAWTGVRPLYKDADTGDDRTISRDFKLLDHRTRDGVPGLVSIVGGKYTTFRLMAERTVDLVAEYLANTTACRTHQEPAERTGDGTLFWLGAPPPAPATHRGPQSRLLSRLLDHLLRAACRRGGRCCSGAQRLRGVSRAPKLLRPADAVERRVRRRAALPCGQSAQAAALCAPGLRDRRHLHQLYADAEGGARAAGTPRSRRAAAGREHL